MASELSYYPAYSISWVDFHDIQLRSRRNINKTTSPWITEEENEETLDTSPIQYEEAPDILLFQYGDNNPPIPSRKPQETEKKWTPSYTQFWIVDKLMPQSKFDLLGELWNVSVNITLIQYIRDIPIYSKSIRELCLKKLRWKRKDPPTVCVIGDLV